MKSEDVAESYQAGLERACKGDTSRLRRRTKSGQMMAYAIKSHAECIGEAGARGAVALTAGMSRQTRSNRTSLAQETTDGKGRCCAKLRASEGCVRKCSHHMTPKIQRDLN